MVERVFHQNKGEIDCWNFGYAGAPMFAATNTKNWKLEEVFREE